MSDENKSPSPSPSQLKPGDTLWLINQAGQMALISDEANLVTVVGEQAFADGVMLKVSNGAFVNPISLRGVKIRTVVEDFGKVKLKDKDPPEKWESRIETVTYRDPVRCWRTKADWEEHVRTQRAWNKLASRILQQSPDDMDPFTVDDIEAAELALFGSIQE